jgi:foldase protein PrsA
LPHQAVERIIGGVIFDESRGAASLAGLRFAIIVALMLILAACSPSSPTEAIPVTSEPTQIPATPDPANAGLVAKVNGVGISEIDYNRAIERRVASGLLRDRALEQQVFQELIEQELIRQGAPSLGITVTPVDVEAEIAAQREIAGSEEAWEQSLSLNNYSEEEWFAAQEDVLLTLGVRNKLLEPYMGDVEQVNARHIVVRTQDEAEAAMNRLNNGEDFASLAAEVSIDVTTRDTGGNLGWFARNELFYPNLEEVAFNLEVGQIAGPVATSIGYHIIQTMDKGLRPVELDRLQNVSVNVFNAWLDEQYRNAMIEAYIQW